MEQNFVSKVNGVFAFAMVRLFLEKAGKILGCCGEEGRVLS